MQAARPGASHRRTRPAPRLVVPGSPIRKRRAPIEPTGALGYLTGLTVLELIDEHFPDAYQQHLADQPATPEMLAICAQLFLTLVSKRVPISETTYLIDYCASVADALHWPSNEDPILCLAEAADCFNQPEPLFYGLGVGLVLDAPDELGELSPLTLALWRLFDGTSYGLGIEFDDFLADYTDEYELDQETLETLRKLRSLPATTPVDRLLARLEHSRKPPMLHEAACIQYAFAQNENPLLQISWGELMLVYGGQHDITWDHLERLEGWAAEAKTITNAYRAWAAQIEIDPATTLPALARRLHRVAKAVTHEQPQRLIDLFTPTDEDTHDD